MHKNDDLYKCRVCGYKNPIDSPWGVDGQTATYNICPCCGVTHGYQDCLPSAIFNYRQSWIKSGAKWNAPSLKPKDWTMDQLSLEIPEPFKTETIRLTRKKILQKIIEYNAPISENYQLISHYEYETSETLIRLELTDVIRVLKKLLNKEITRKDVVDWADFLKMRDDMETDDKARIMIKKLSTLEKKRELTHEEIKKCIEACSEEEA